MRFTPQMLDIPADDPFKHDLLDRRGAAVALTELIQLSSGSFVLAVDADWGKGKTTFLEMWSCFLRKESYPLVQFNAWETDFASNPFVALFQELSSALSRYERHLAPDTISTLTSNAKSVIRWAVPGALRVGASFIPVVGSQVGESFVEAIDSMMDSQLSAYDQEKASLSEFKRSLQVAARDLTSAHDNNPIVIMIDEIDRCRPSYAVELLEVAKHIFSVDGVVFVLAINRKQLARSVKALYGNEFDAVEYLRRFIDVDFALPDPEREDFVNAHLLEIEFQESFARTVSSGIAVGPQYAQSALQLLLGNSDLSLRDVQKAIKRLGLVMTSLDGRLRSLVMVATVLVSLRAVDPDLYLRFISGSARDLEVVEYLQDYLGDINLDQRDTLSMIERVVVAIDVVRQRDQAPNRRAAEAIDTPLLAKSRAVLNDAENASDEARSRARNLIALADDLKTRLHTDYQARYQPLIDRIELVATSITTA